MKKLVTIFSILITSLSLYGVTFAQVMQSPSYQLPESYVGPGSGFAGGSTNFSSYDTAGDIGIGTSTSANFGSQGGFNTSDEPRLAMVVNSASLVFGNFSTAVSTTATASFSVLNYTSHGYSVFIVGSSPSNGSYNLTSMSGESPATGVEQFGINLVANTSPSTLGSNPVQVPSSGFSYGAASAGYGTTNTYKYVNGEAIAESTKSSGQTDYTISYIINTSVTTPGGKYTGSQNLIVVGTY